MLSLEPPSYDIGGILLYRDHAVPHQFYYAAPAPKISRAGGQLMFDLFAYRVELRHSPLAGTSIPDELGAGFLNMGADCALTDAQRANLLREMESRTGIPEARLALYPIPYHKGTVRVLALDQFTTPGEPQAPGGAASPEPLKGRPTFVEKVIGAATPSLLGDLRAIFSLGLSQEGVVFLQGLYRERAAPVGVVYELRFHGLRPSVEAVITANLSRIYQHFGGGLSGQYQWIKADIDVGLDYLREHGAFDVKLTTQATGEAAEKSRELAVSLFKDRIVQEMFRPITAAPPARTGDALSSLAGTAGTGSIGLTLRFKRAEELKTAIYNFSERAPEERTHAPQGFLPLLLSPAELERRVHQIDLEHAFFQNLEVLVTGPIKEEFEALGIRQVEATLAYGSPSDGVPPEQQTLLFRPEATGDKTFAVKRRGRKSVAYTCALAYEFLRRAGVDTDRFRYDMPLRSCTSRALRINPYEDFGVLDVEVEPGRLHPDVREVDVHLAYRTPDNRFTAEEQFRIAPAGPDGAASRRRWQVRTLQREVSPYTAAYTFIFQDGAVYKAPPRSFTDPLLRVDAPFQHERKLLIRPNVTSPQITQLTVELEYADPASAYERRFLLTLDAPFSSKTFAWPILDPNRQVVRYRVTAHEPGFISEGDWLETADPSIVPGSAGSRVAKVQVRLIGATLAEAGLDAVQLKIELLVDGTGGGEAQSFLLEGNQTSQEVKLALPPGAPLRYRYQTVAYKSDGRVVESEWKEMTSPLLVISTRTL